MRCASRPGRPPADGPHQRLRRNSTGRGPDYGSQYRTAISFHDAEQEKAAKASKERLAQSGKYRKPIVTELVPAGEFYMAEDYHQRYFEKCGIAPTCHGRALAG